MPRTASTDTDEKFPTDGVDSIKADDPDAHEAIGELLQKAGVWDEYSSISYAAVRRMAQTQGDEDNEVFLKLLPDLTFGIRRCGCSRVGWFRRGSYRSRIRRLRRRGDLSRFRRYIWLYLPRPLHISILHG